MWCLDRAPVSSQILIQEEQHIFYVSKAEIQTLNSLFSKAEDLVKSDFLTFSSLLL